MNKVIVLTLCLALATDASAGSITIKTSAVHDLAIASLVNKENAARAAKLAEINKGRDSKLPPRTAAEEGLSPVTALDVLYVIVSKSLQPEVDAIADQAAEATAQAAIAAVAAIKALGPDCATKATAAGLDPAKVCR